MKLICLKADAAETVAVNDNAAMDDPVKVYLKEMSRVRFLHRRKKLNLLSEFLRMIKRPKKRLAAEFNLRLVVSIAKRYVGRGMRVS